MTAGEVGDVGHAIASAIKDVVMSVIDFLVPIVNTVAISLILIGLLLIALRQEFYGIRLILGGGVSLIILHLVLPVVLSFL
ncbi:MAG: hypothetical protein B9J98_00030 [Candidatus Terraquivivens tikiterensis]|uniref:Uncharacterized protein n=1 Tax=Candidatus Terraquivivens tikiterensis TaxID=1980982 RepID=A0A2R7Y9V5_9ARCH|nr:MAG: hypothetical protein B9J98_00030 [Candidatus Terraquivivens tikiterensis]